MTDIIMSQKNRRLLFASGLALVVVAGLLFGTAFAQTTTVTESSTGNLIDSSTALLASLGTFAAAVGGILITLGPWISKINKKYGDYTTSLGNELIKSDHYATTIAEEIKKNKSRAEIMEQVILSMTDVNPDIRKRYDEMKQRIADEEDKIREQTERERQYLETLHAQLPKSIDASALENEKTL